LKKIRKMGHGSVGSVVGGGEGVIRTWLRCSLGPERKKKAPPTPKLIDKSDPSLGITEEMAKTLDTRTQLKRAILWVAGESMEGNRHG